MKAIYQKPFFILLAVFIFLTTLVFYIWLPNLSFISQTIFSSYLAPTQKTGILVASLGALNTNFTTISRLLAVAIALLFGINFSLTVYYLKLKLELARTVTTSLSGLLLGTIGAGCASCGSVILASLLGTTASVSLVSALPLAGNEFGVLSIIILGLSIILLLRKIKEPLFCQTG